MSYVFVDSNYTAVYYTNTYASFFKFFLDAANAKTVGGEAEATAISI